MKKILIVEDNSVNRELLREILESRLYAVEEAQNGLEALNKIQESTPDLVLLDIQMPVLDGIAAIKRLRDMPQFTSLPVLALTAYAMVGDKERVLAAGFTGYITKPIKTAELISAIQTHLNGTAVHP